MTTIFPIIILIICITGAVISVRNWNDRCRTARTQFIANRNKPRY